MAQLRVKAVASAQGLNLNQLYQALNTARAGRGDAFVSVNTVRRYWHSTENGTLKGKPLDIVSWSFLQEVAGVLGVSVYELLPAEDGLGNTMPRPHPRVNRAA